MQVLFLKTSISRLLFSLLICIRTSLYGPPTHFTRVRRLRMVSSQGIIRLIQSKSLTFLNIWQGPFRNGSPQRGLFKPSTAPFRHEHKRVLEDTKKSRLSNNRLNSNEYIVTTSGFSILLWLRQSLC